MSDTSIRQLGPKRAAQAIRKSIKVKRPIFVWGSPGLGKSDVVQQIGDSENREVIDVRLALWEPTDIKGIPYYNNAEGKMVWAPPAELPTDPESTAIIFLDELSSAPPAVQAAAYQLILNRRVGTYKLPDGVDIVAAGNKEGDRGVSYRMPTPLANRFVHVEMVVDFDDWIDWATLNKIHADVIGYLSWAKQDLYCFDPKSPCKAFATPRSWSFVSQLIADDDVSEKTMHDLIAGSIGDGLAIKFLAQRKIASQLPSASEVLDGKVKELKIKEISAKYALTTNMCYELKDRADKKDKKWNAAADNFFAFMMDNFEPEIVVMGAKTAISNFNLPIDTEAMKTFDRFHEKYGKYILAASEGR